MDFQQEDITDLHAMIGNAVRGKPEWPIDAAVADRARRVRALLAEPAVRSGDLT